MVENMIHTEPGVKMDLATFERFLANNLPGFEAVRVYPKVTEVWPRKDPVKWEVSRHGLYLGNISALEVGDGLALDFFQVDFETPDPAILAERLPPGAMVGNPNKGSAALAESMRAEIVAALGRCGAIPPEPSAAQPQPVNGLKDSGHYAHSPEKRREIVAAYEAARAAGDVENKDAWARANHGITGKTLKAYEAEVKQRPTEP